MNRILKQELSVAQKQLHKETHKEVPALVSRNGPEPVLDWAGYEQGESGTGGVPRLSS